MTHPRRLGLSWAGPWYGPAFFMPGFGGQSSNHPPPEAPVLPEPREIFII